MQKPHELCFQHLLRFTKFLNVLITIPKNLEYSPTLDQANVQMSPLEHSRLPSFLSKGKKDSGNYRTAPNTEISSEASKEAIW